MRQRTSDIHNAGTHAEVSQQAIHALGLALEHDASHSGIVGVEARQRARELRLKPGLGPAQLSSVCVEPINVTCGANSTQQLAGVAAVAQRAVDEPLSRLRVQRRQDLLHADGAVCPHGGVPLSLDLAHGHRVAGPLLVLVSKRARVAPAVSRPAHVWRLRLLGALLSARTRRRARAQHVRLAAREQVRSERLCLNAFMGR